MLVGMSAVRVPDVLMSMHTSVVSVCVFEMFMRRSVMRMGVPVVGMDMLALSGSQSQGFVSVRVYAVLVAMSINVRMPVV